MTFYLPAKLMDKMKPARIYRQIFIPIESFFSFTLFFFNISLLNSAKISTFMSSKAHTSRLLCTIQRQTKAAGRRRKKRSNIEATAKANLPHSIYPTFCNRAPLNNSISGSMLLPDFGSGFYLRE